MINYTIFHLKMVYVSSYFLIVLHSFSYNGTETVRLLLRIVFFLMCHDTNTSTSKDIGTCQKKKEKTGHSQKKGKERDRHLPQRPLANADMSSSFSLPFCATSELSTLRLLSAKTSNTARLPHLVCWLNHTARINCSNSHTHCTLISQRICNFSTCNNYISDSCRKNERGQS